MPINLETLKRDLQSEKQAPFWATAAIGEVGLALVEVVEALDEFSGEWGHSSHCYHRASARGWNPGSPPVLDCVCGLARIEDALKPFVQVDSGGL